MIGAFPVGYPDELLYSICARYADRMQYSSPGAVSEELFGLKQISASVALPARLDTLVANLPPLSSYTSDKILLEHTMFPLYAYFLPEERVERLKAAMKGESGTGVWALAAVGRKPQKEIKKQGLLRLCRLCVQEDRKVYGECYWHRAHQLPEIEVCHKHSVWLEASDIFVRHRVRDYEFQSAEGAAKMLTGHSGKNAQPRDKAPQILHALAHDAACLLNSYVDKHNPGKRQQLYHDALVIRGLAVTGGLIRTKELIQSIEAYFGDNVLSLLGRPLDGDAKQNWCVYLARPGGHAQAPVCHLLMMHFLGYSVEEFSRLDGDAFAPFGVGPWPCLNKAADHFGQPVIEDCTVRPTKGERHGIRGVFSCTCGFVYTRRGPDTCAEDKMLYANVESFGPTWEAALRHLWLDPALSVRAVAERLGVTKPTVGKHAHDLGLVFPKPGWQNNTLRPDRLHRPRQPKQISKETREQYRAEWLRARQEHPDAGRYALSRLYRRVDQWLRVHDKEWLEKNMPDRRRRSGPTGPFKDWDAIDETISMEVAAAAMRLRNLPGRPVRLSTNSINKELQRNIIGTVNLHSPKTVDHRPRIAKALKAVVETPEEFTIRRIWWVAEDNKRAGKQISRNYLMVSAGAFIWRHHPNVAQALTDGVAFCNGYDAEP